VILFGLGLGAILLGGVAACALGHRRAMWERVFGWAALGGCALALSPAVSVLIASSSGSGRTVPTDPKAWFAIDTLSAWFLLAVLGVGAAIAAYGVPYLAPERGHRPTGLAHLLVSVLLVALSGVVTARTIVAFMVSWEVMALAAFFLVIFEHEKGDVWTAGMIYLVLTHVCTLALLGMYAAWAGGHAGAHFEELAERARGGLAPAGLVLALGLVGFGIKAGVFPFHFWLPGAHAAAPSHVSALLSGVMLKMGIYGLLRVIMLVGTPPAWWGWTVLLLGLASSVLGVLWALAQHDLKRLLAYHSVENIGIILLGIGLGALGTAYHQPAVALLGYAGALLHVLNHSLFKSLLFLGAGAVVRETGTREIDRMGGLARSMPRTAAAFLIGAVAIVGLPPLNGFVSEWLIFRGLLGAGVAGGGIRVAAPVAVGLALTGALALACFSKLFGVVFLGVPRGSGERAADESWLFAPQWALAGACVAIGLAPGFVVSIVLRAAASLVPGASGDVPGVWRPSLALSALSALLLVVTALAWWARVHARRPRAASVTWGCAYPVPTPRMQYTASSYASPLLAAFGPITGIHEERSAGAFQSHAADPILDRAAEPLWAWLQAVAARVRVLQGGFVRRYLLYSIVCLMGLLLYLRFRALP
jgi:hydrogenase-4 component B